MKSLVKQLSITALLLVMSASSLAEMYTVNFNNADIKDVIKYVADATGYTVIVDPKVKGNVTLVSKKQVDKERLYNLFLTVLNAHNYTAIKNGDVLRVIPDKSARSTSTPVRSGRPWIDNHEFVTQIIELKNINATKLIPVLRPLVPQQGHMAAYADANSIIITDTADNVKKVHRIIEKLDKTTLNEMEIFRLKHSSADEFVKIVDKVITQGAGKDKNNPDKQASIVADTRSNSLIVTGSEQQRLKVRRLIEELDGPLEDSGNANVFTLKHAKAKDLAPILSKVSQSLSKISSDGKAKGTQAQSASIEADEATNSLIITASGDVLESLNSIIKKLDVQRAQVLVEAIIVEVSVKDDRGLGVNWLAASEGGGFGGSNHTDGLLGALALGAFETDQEDVVKGVGSALSSVKGGSYGGALFDVAKTSFVAIINALEETGETNILSTPSLMTLDNNEAQIVVGQEVPFVTGSYTSTGSSSSNPGDPFQTIERENVGITLKVTPHVNDGDQITLDILQEVSGISGSTSDISTGNVVTNERKIETSVSTGDGETIVLGGLISDQVEETVSKVPFLGDIPLIGRLFKSSSTTVEKKNLMVFIRPTVIRNSARALETTREQYDRIRGVQLIKEQRGVDLFKDEVLPVLPDWQNDLDNAAILNREAEVVSEETPDETSVLEPAEVIEPATQPEPVEADDNAETVIQ